MNRFRVIVEKTKEKMLADELKEMLDDDANFVKPLSEFWKGCSENECNLVNHYGLWISGEGGSKIDGEYAAHYYDEHDGCEKLKSFLDKHNLKIYWYDCGTPVIIGKEDEVF